MSSEGFIEIPDGKAVEKHDDSNLRPVGIFDVDFWFQVLAISNIITDVMVIFNTFQVRPRVDEYSDHLTMQWAWMLFLIGFGIWMGYIWVRLFVESMIEAGSRDRFRDMSRCSLRIMFMCCFCSSAGLGILIMAEKALRAALAPFDLLLGIGYYASQQRWVFLVADHLFFFTQHEQREFKAMPFYKKYINIYTNLLAGGRWKPKIFLQIGQSSAGKRHVLAGAIGCIIAEEVLQNIGGLVMVVAYLFLGTDNTVLCAISVSISIFSLFVETGKYIGDYVKLNAEGDEVTVQSSKTELLS